MHLADVCMCVCETMCRIYLEAECVRPVVYPLEIEENIYSLLCFDTRRSADWKR
jgi:hypothetical protein